jgi:serine/threonine protein kinase
VLHLAGFDITDTHFICEHFSKEKFTFILSNIDRIFSECKVVEKTLEETKPELDQMISPRSDENSNFKRPILRKFRLEKENADFEVYEQYEVQKVLGHGAYGIVVLAYDTINKRNVAIKKMFNTFSQGVDYQKRILREIQLMMHFKNHPNIINIVDLILPKSYRDFSDIYIVMECMSQDMAKFVRSKNPLDDPGVQFFMYQMLCGLYAIHSANVIHRDLKPSNILINDELDVRICDFGLARGLDLMDVEDPHMSTFYVVTRWYRSPELCMSYEKSYKALDVWSMGCILAELLQKPIRKPLFPGTDTLKQLKLIVDVLGPQDKSDIKGVPNAVNYIAKIAKSPKMPWNEHPSLSHVTNEQAFDLLDKMLQFNPEKRISVEDALKHPYFTELYDDIDLKTYPIVSYHFDEVKALKEKEYCKGQIYELIVKFNQEVNGLAGDAEMSKFEPVTL